MRKACLAIAIAILPIQGWGQERPQQATSDFLLNAVYCWGAAWQGVENARAGIDENCRAAATLQQINACGAWGATEAHTTPLLGRLQRFLETKVGANITDQEDDAYSRGRSDEAIIASRLQTNAVKAARKRLNRCGTIMDSIR